MKSRAFLLLSTGVLFLQSNLPMLAQSDAQNQRTANKDPDRSSYAPYKPSASREPNANIMDMPRQILKTGVILTSKKLSSNSLQLSDSIGLTPILNDIELYRDKIRTFNQQGEGRSLECLHTRQDLQDAIQKAEYLIQRVNLEVDFTNAEIEAECQLYNEILGEFIEDRDKKVARINAASFISNGILWTVCEALAIGSINTTYARNPRKCLNLTIPSGIVGIAAGLVPSIASMYTLKAVNGAKKRSEAEPNMLAMLFNYPQNSEIEYPQSVWKFLHQIPADCPNTKPRIDHLIDRWISDSNIPDFNDRKSKAQLDVLTASVPREKGMSIETLTSRTVMLMQLHAEIQKMKRFLLELTLAVQGEKQLSLGAYDAPHLREHKL
ncbi:MAG: hypothetical protein KIT34_07475 [Cyanobacteria bacterium TGS_CYA1]|nr:hypothetical protein [Cyanobacteria bacterium TGS_CYA1]